MFSNEEGNSTQHSGLVFHVLVSIFSLLQSNKFQHFRPVMNEYIENHFAAALVYKGLITSVEHMAVFMTKAEHPDPFQKCFGSLEYIFKLLIQSRKLFARATGGQYEDSFRRDLHSLFTALNGMLAVPSYDVIIPTQEALLNSTGVVLEQLKDTLPAPELGMLARNMLDAIPRDAPIRLVQAKLQAVKDLVSGELFHEDDSRTVILSVACKHLRMHLSRRDELKLCADILSEILTHLYDLQKEQKEKVTNTLQHDLDSLCKNILGILIKTITIILEGSNSVLPQLVACLLGLLQLLDEHIINAARVSFRPGGKRTYRQLDLLISERLLDYRSVMQGEENRDKRMSCTVNLLNFYKNEINRKEMYLRYIYKLHALHLQAENYTEAGFTLKLYANMLSWGESITCAPNDPIGKPEWQRKEELYHEVVLRTVILK
ncbi:hypothetical protein DOY81_011833 [Sarcophaga bullata]|nr:hypothetical protein DOY81_011833 [Sarcophaga bullata]